MNQKLKIEMGVVEHESRLTIALLRTGDHPSDTEKLDSCSVGGPQLDINADDLQSAFNEAVTTKADYIDDDWEHIVVDNEMGGAARLDGHRIAVYHIIQYRDGGYSPEEIADEFNLEVEAVEEAIEYADENDIE